MARARAETFGPASVACAKVSKGREAHIRQAVKREISIGFLSAFSSWPLAFGQAFDKFGDALANFVPNFTHAFRWLTFWVGNGPIFNPQSRNERTIFAASHGDEQVGVRGQLSGEQLRTSAA